MASKLQRKTALCRKLRILKTLTKSKSVKKSSIIMDAFVYIYKLKLQVEAIKKEYQYLIHHTQEVKVEKIGTGYLKVTVTCKKADELLGSIMEAFDNLKLNVAQARVSCSHDHFFWMEAIVESSTNIDHETILGDAIFSVIQSQTDKKCT